MSSRAKNKTEAAKQFVKSSSEKTSTSKKPKPGSVLKPITPEDFGTGDSSIYAPGPREDTDKPRDPWSFRENDGTVVTVTDIEKEEYFIGFTNDEPFTWEL